MIAEVNTVQEIEVLVEGFFTTHHLLQTQTEVVGELTVPAMSKQAIFVGAGDDELEMRKPSWWKSYFELRRAGSLLGSAGPKRFFSRDVVVEYGTERYVLCPAGFWSRAWQLVDAEENVLVEVEPRGAFRRGAYLTALDQVDRELLVFTYFLVQERWQAETATAAVAAS